MKQNDLRNALSHINKDYLAESDDFKAVSDEFRKQKSHRIQFTISALSLVLLFAGVIWLGKSDLLKRNIKEADINTVSDVLLTSETTTSAVQTEAPIISDSTNTDQTLYYSKLVKNTDLPELDGYDISAGLSISAFDIDAFAESIIKDSISMIEGEIIDMWVNHYEYETASDKFEPNGRLHHKASTVAYKIRADRVLIGDFSVGDEIIVEDYYFILDSVISIKKGGHYVIPIAKGDGVIWDHDEVVSGNNVLESNYCTIYQFHPQIEKVSGGYIVPDDWKTLITDECSEIIMDTENNFNRTMFFVPDSIFNERIKLILQN